MKRHHVKILNISIRHALPDPGTLLSWAREEVFAFVIYHKQETTPSARGAVAVWTRELIEAAIALGGTYYLPYQAHATPAQFHRAYPRARELFALKRRLDPDYRLRHVLWNTYYSHPNDQTSL
jgi:FAD/FMN-containing dehydrogenase